LAISKNRAAQAPDSRDRAFHFFNHLFLLAAIAVILIPLIHVVSQSLSDPSAVLNGRVTLLPVEPTVSTYAYVMRDKDFLRGFANSALYTSAGTAIAVLITIMAAYPLSRQEFVGKRVLMGMIAFTMIFEGGMIPLYIVQRNLHLVDTMWAIILQHVFSAFNIIIAKTFFTTNIPTEMYEAAEIDGADDFTIFFRIVIPLSKSIMAVMVLIFALFFWNNYFDALIYFNTAEKYPLQLVLRNIVTSAQVQSRMVELTGVVGSNQMLALTESLKYVTTVCASIPVLLLYPFIQKHFQKGLMVGTVKG
jgi:ABC-type glycerol-3-phosphate transport system permease component